MSFRNFNGPYGGLAPPVPVAGGQILPYGFFYAQGTVTITASRAYIIPFPIFQTQVFSGAFIRDSGASNNGQLLRCGLYAQGSSGGPGSLLKDFGLVTLSGTAGVHQYASSYTALGPQMTYMILVGNSASVLKTVTSGVNVSNVGIQYPPTFLTSLPQMTSGGLDWSIPANAAGYYAALTYPGSMPSTAPTPTNDLSDTLSGSVPLIGLYA